MATMQSSNPVLHAFEKPQTWDQLDARERKLGAMTMLGTVHATAMLLGIVVATAFLVWSMLPQQYLWMAALSSALGGLVFTLIIAFKPRTAPILGFPAAACEGVFVGALSLFYAAWVGSMDVGPQTGGTMRALAAAGSGLIVQAVLLTFGVFGVMLIAYSTRTIRATPALMKGIVAATGAVFFMWIAYFLLRMFTDLPSILEMGWLGVGICGAIVVIAAFNLIIDFKVIEDGVRNEAPKHMEWFGAFGLMITLVWLYVSILRLLAMIAAMTRE